MPPLFIRESEVAELLDMAQAVEAVEDCFRLLGRREADNRPRQRPRLPGAVLQVMPAAVPGYGLGLKAYTVTAKGARFVVLLWDPASGDLQAVIEAGRLGKLRTGAATGVAARYLARQDASRVGLIGTGGQAEAQLEAVCRVRRVREVLAFSPTAERRERFAGSASERLRVPVRAVGTAREAVQGAQIVIAVTTASEPVLEAAWVAEGTHVSSAGSNRIQAREIGVDLVGRADLVVVDDAAQARLEAGNLLPAVAEGRLGWDDLVELGAIVAGKALGRSGRAAVTLFNSLGIAAEDVVVARRVYERAREEGAGVPLPDTILG